MELEQALRHEPVLLKEVIELLKPQPGERVLDATVGLGGHAEALLVRIQPGGRLIGLDQDAAALKKAAEHLAKYEKQVQLFHANFSELKQCLAKAAIPEVDRLLFDCGMSSFQLADASRGFSFQVDGPLDMRMNQATGETAGDLIASLSEQALAALFWELGEESCSRRIAHALVQARKHYPIQGTGVLADTIERALPFLPYPRRTQAKARIFQALRMEVNQELPNLTEGLTQGMDSLKLGGRMAVISFHSLEDRIVKMAFRERAKVDVRLVNKKVVKPTREEVLVNPRARSSKLRVIEKWG